VPSDAGAPSAAHVAAAGHGAVTAAEHTGSGGSAAPGRRLAVPPPAWAERVVRRLRRGRRADPAPAEPSVPAPPRVAVVTDSTSCLTAADAARWGIDVVPLDVAADGERFRDGVDLSPDDLAVLLAAGRRVTTSQPPPAAFLAAYEAAAARGAAEVVSVHLSGELSGTVRAAGLAAQLAPLPVHVVDSRSAGLGLGLAAVAAAEASRGTVWGPAGAAEVAATAEQVGRSTAAWFVVDSLDHLRRGGRLSAAAAAFGTVLGLRPVLVLRDGRIEVAERVRTRRAARDRLHALAAAEVVRRGPRAVRVGVQHLGRADVAAEVAERLRTSQGLDEVLVREVGAVLGGHLGVGALAVTVTDR